MSIIMVFFDGFHVSESVNRWNRLTVNKTSSTVWLRHGPSGLEVRCQRERSQAANRELAWLELCAKLEARARAAKAEVVDAREMQRRRTRQKSHGQKVRMIQSKKHRARIKSRRGRPEAD